MFRFLAKYRLTLQTITHPLISRLTPYIITFWQHRQIFQQTTEPCVRQLQSKFLTVFITAPTSLFDCRQQQDICLFCQTSGPSHGRIKARI